MTWIRPRYGLHAIETGLQVTGKTCRCGAVVGCLMVVVFFRAQVEQLDTA
jgi:hypothetical protein